MSDKIVDPALAAMLVPGDHPTESSGRKIALPDLRPCGKCDGVIYLAGGKTLKINPDGKLLTDPKGEPVVIDVPSAEREALRYLRPMPVEWHAMYSAHNHGARCVGISKPEVQFLFPLEILEARQKTGRPIEWMFTMDDHCVMAVQRQHVNNWRVFKTPTEDVWAVIYVPQSSGS